MNFYQQKKENSQSSVLNNFNFKEYQKGGRRRKNVFY